MYLITIGSVSLPQNIWKTQLVAVAAVLASVAFIECKFSADFNKLARNDSRLTCQGWLDELLPRHLKWLYASMGINKHVFHTLLQELITVGLYDTRYVSSEEQLAIFLFLAVMGVAQHHLEKCFQCSPDTILKCISSNLCHSPCILKIALRQFTLFLICLHVMKQAKISR